jgi:hypothetical protein
MSTLAEFPQGIPIPTEEIRSALESVAVPGFTGTLQMTFALRTEAASCVSFAVIRRQTKRVDQEPTTRQTLPDPTRKKPVDKVIADIKGKLFIRTLMAAFEVNVVDGVLQKTTIVD